MFWLYLAEKFQCATHFAAWSSPGDSDDLDTPASKQLSTDAQLPNRKSQLRSSPVDASLSNKKEGVLTNWLACALPLLPCTRLPKVSFQSPAYTHVRDSEPRQRSWLSCLPSHMRMEDFPDTCKGLLLSWMLLPCPDRAVFVLGYH
jgi:hypothetical protein